LILARSAKKSCALAKVAIRRIIATCLNIFEVFLMNFKSGLAATVQDTRINSRWKLEATILSGSLGLDPKRFSLSDCIETFRRKTN
jgi:hypothetical protein